MTSDGSPKWGIISDKVHVVDAGVTVASLLANVTITYLADYLALAEYALVKRLTSSIEMPIGFVDGLTLPGGPLSAAADEHGTGEAGLIAVDSAYYRGLGAGLLELIDALKRHGLFDHTLIHYTGDFSRTPRDGMSDGAHGSDHGFDACVTSFYSGAIDGPVLVGNIALNPSSTYSAAYPGTWGLAAPIAELGAPPGPAHVASSIAAIMGIARHPWTAAVPLLKVDSGKVVPNVEQPRTVT
jgi:hypothetical protein